MRTDIEVKAHLLQRAADYVGLYPDCQAKDVSSAISDLTRTTISAVSISRLMATDQRFSRSMDLHGNTRYSLSGLPAGTIARTPLTRPIAPEPANEPADAPEKVISIESAITALLGPMTFSVREQIDGMLARITREEVVKAVATAQQSIRSRLRTALLEPLASNDTTNAPAPAPVQESTLQAPIRGKKPGLMPVQKPFEFTNPPGNPLEMHDVVSKRTAFKPHGTMITNEAPAATGLADPDKLPKIIVVGLHSNKQELIKKEFRDKFDLRLFNPDQLTFIKKAISPGDDVICMADYIGHKHTDVVTASGGKMAVVHGGIPSLRDELAERYEIRMAA